MPDYNAPINALVQGNINLYKRPKVLNPDSTISTVRSMSANEDGREVLVPTVIPDKRGAYYVDTQGDAAWQRYQDTGEHLGKFGTPEDATAYASQLHNAYAAGKYDRSGKPILSVAGAPIEMAVSHEPNTRAALLALLKTR